MNETLQGTLDRLLKSGTRSNPALNTLLGDYTKYHLVLVVAGTVLVAVLLLLSGFFCRRWLRAPRSSARRWTFERATYAAFAALCLGVGVIVAALVAIDASNVLDPRDGFQLAADSLGTPVPGSPMAALDHSFLVWLRSGSAAMPALVQTRVDERRAFHATKLAYSAVLLVISLIASIVIWRTLIRRSRGPEARWRLFEGALLVAGGATVVFSLLLLVVVVANLQGALAPISMTLAYG